MDSKLWLGLLWFLVVVGNGIAIVRRQRRSKQIHNYGHPKEDLFLLTTSALVLIAAMGTAFWVLGPKVPKKGSPGEYLIVLLLVLLALGLTSVSNRVLRRKPGRRRM